MVYLLSSKDESEEMHNKYKAEVENQVDRKIKRFRSARVGEYDPTSLKNYCDANRIIHEQTAPYTPKQNGVVERKNRTLTNMMNVMLISFGLIICGGRQFYLHVMYQIMCLIRNLIRPHMDNEKGILLS